MPRSLLFAVSAGLALHVGGLAQADPPGGVGVLGLKLIVIDKYLAADKAKFVFVAKDSTPGAIHKGVSSDPPNLGGDAEMIQLENTSNTGVFDLGETGSVQTGTWLVNKPTVAKYVNKGASPGDRGAKIVVLKPDKLLKIVAKNLGDGDDDTGDQSATDFDASSIDEGDVVRVRVTIDNTGNPPPDTHQMCSHFIIDQVKAIAGGTGIKILSKRAVVPAAFGCEDSCVAVSGTFCDLGDGTVYDLATDLQWETKDGADAAPESGAPNPANPHDVDNPYSWAGECTLNAAANCQPDAAAAATCLAQTGGAFGCTECGGGDGVCDVDPASVGAITTIWDWINQVNAESFAGHTDWRLATTAGGVPTGDPAELESIVDPDAPGCGLGSACIDPLFGPTVVSNYWSASTVSSDPTDAWAVNFSSSVFSAVALDKGFVRGVRAVRLAP